MDDEEYIPVEPKYYNYTAKNELLLYLSDDVTTYNKVYMCAYKVNTEAKLPFSIEKSIKSAKLSWSEDEERAEELQDENKGDFSNVYVYTANDKNRGSEYIFKTWLEEHTYWIELEEDETVIFSQDYSQNEKRYYDQDCENILGFSF